MTLPELSVRRPIGTAMIFLAVLLLGVVGLREIAIDLLPEVDAPRITVTSNYEGVAPQEIETLLTRPIEEAISTVDGVERIQSTSTEGTARVQLQFQWGMNLDEAVNDVRAQLDRIRSVLPEEAEPPTVLKFDLSAASVAHIGLSGSGDARRLRYLAEEELTRRLEAIPGVARVDVRGGRRREIRVELSRERMLAHGIDVADVSAALARENRDVSAGDMLEGGQEVVIRTEGEFRSVEEIGDTIVAQREARAIPLREIGTVVDGVQEIRDQLWIDGVPGIRLIISKQSNANTMSVVAGLRAELEDINRDYAGRAEMIMLRDSGRFIEQSVTGVRTSALLGGGLAVLVLLVFLRDIRTTLVVATTIPISIMATLALMFFYEITLNLISFGGLALGVGMLVDNAIVIIENIHRKREEGLGPDEAAIEGANEVASAVVAGTLTTLAVFVPVVFLGGFAGVFFREMALVVCFALSCSLVVALTLVPSLSAALDRRFPRRTPLRTRDGSGTLLERGYGRFLRRALTRPASVLGIGVALCIAASAGVPWIATELMPETDEGRLEVDLELPAGTPLQTTASTVEEVTRRIKDIVREDELEHIVAVAGPQNWWSPAGSNRGSVDVMLVPASERDRPQDEVIIAIQDALADLPGADVRVSPESENLLLRVMRGGGNDRLSIDIAGHDMAAAELLANSIKRKVEAVDGVSYARLERELGQLERTLVVDRRRLGELGLGASQVAAAIEHFVLGRVATRFRDRGEEYDVRVVLREQERRRLEQLATLPIALPSGGTVPVSQVARIEERVGPSSLAREDQQRVLKIGIGIAGRDLGAIVRDLQPIVDGIAVPRGFTIRVGGEFREQQETFWRLGLGGILALFLVYAVMAVQFESVRGPLVVMAAIPFAFVGVILVLVATGTSLNMNSALGTIMLVGIIVNNAIVLIDHINLLHREQAMPLLQAVHTGAVKRLRPVLMTTLTTVLALVPLALGLDEGSELQAPLARAVVGGLSLSTLVTLVVVPALHYLVERRSAAKKQRDLAL